MASDVTGRAPGPLPKPTKREPKLSQPLQRKTPMRRVSLMVPHDQIERAKQLKLNGPPREKRMPRQVPDEWRNIFTEVKMAWFLLNPPEYDGDYYQCRLCPYAVHKDVLTLDHIKPRSTHPHLKYEFYNLQPAHVVCNSLKGSMSMAAYFQTYPEKYTGQAV